ncbi:hypothetical protein [Tritonibacter mobilis]|uniref:hypothetical protein n=1 Tax=Tritonibacter mobilis TaxID=379347 RepID=UPI000E0D3EC8|nr:hypothetical protein [Tritonibacter mobilis]
MIDVARPNADATREEYLARLEGEISSLIRERVGAAVDDVQVDWCGLEGDEEQFEITVLINAQANPRDWRRSFAGLTTKVKDTLGERHNRLFPVISAKAS